jgi:hypothetical protein
MDLFRWTLPTDNLLFPKAEQLALAAHQMQGFDQSRAAINGMKTSSLVERRLSQAERSVVGCIKFSIAIDLSWAGGYAIDVIGQPCDCHIL